MSDEKEEEEAKDPLVDKQLYQLVSHGDIGINIYDYGHIDGMRFILDEPITFPGGGTAEIIDFSHVVRQLEGEADSRFLEETIAAILAPGLVERSVPASPEDIQKIRGQQYN